MRKKWLIANRGNCELGAGLLAACLLSGCGETDETRIYAAELQSLEPESADKEEREPSVRDSPEPGESSTEESPEQGVGAGLLETVTNPRVSASLCRWSAVGPASLVGAAAGGGNALNCEERVAQCELADAGLSADSATLRSATTIATAVPQLLVSEQCELPPSQVDLCAAELLRFMAPSLAELTCDNPQLQLPPITLATISQMPSCFLLVVACPSLLSSLTNFAGGAGFTPGSE